MPISYVKLRPHRDIVACPEEYEVPDRDKVTIAIVMVVARNGKASDQVLLTVPFQRAHYSGPAVVADRSNTFDKLRLALQWQIVTGNRAGDIATPDRIQGDSIQGDNARSNART